MASRENISVSFTPQQARFLASCVASGRYLSTSEVVREGVRLLEALHERRRHQLEYARAMIQQGANQLERGEVIDGTAFFQEWDDELDSLAADQRRKAE